MVEAHCGITGNVGTHEEQRPVSETTVHSKKTGNAHKRSKHSRRTQVSDAPPAGSPPPGDAAPLRSATQGLAEAEPVLTAQKYSEELRDLLPALGEFFENFKADVIKRPPDARSRHKGYGEPHFVGDIEPTGISSAFLGPENRRTLIVATVERAKSAMESGFRGVVPSTWGTVEDWAGVGQQVKVSELDDPVVLVEDEAVSEGTKVYSATQLEGYVPTEPPEPKDRTPCLAKSIEDLHNMEEVRINPGHFMSCYYERTDMVWVLPEGHHEDSLNYMKVVAHEVGHSTGHPDRLNRKLPDPDRPHGVVDADYAFEEMVAEITAVIVTNRLLARNSQELGEPSRMSEQSTNQSANYVIGYWGRSVHDLRGEAVEALQRAIVEGERAADWVLERVPNHGSANTSGDPWLQLMSKQGRN